MYESRPEGPSRTQLSRSGREVERDQRDGEMAGPRRDGQEAMALRYRAALSQAATIVPFDDRAADLYATVRAQTRVRQPDGIQLACAASHGVELFVTNDDKLWKLRVPDVHFIVSTETALSLVP